MDGAVEPADDGGLYGLMEIVAQQQAAVQVALEGLTAERVALAREREALARGVRDVQICAQGAVRSAVADSLAGAATEGVAAVQAATAPLLVHLAGVTEQAGQADAALRGVVAWASWRLLVWIARMAGEHVGAVVGYGGDRGGAGGEGASRGRGGGDAGQPRRVGQDGNASQADPVQSR